MTCPDLDQLTGPHTPAIVAHLAKCPACRIVVDLADERAIAIDDRAACARFEDLLAVRGGLTPTLAAELDAHLESCVACRAIANTMSPVDAPRQGTLPTVEASAYAFGNEVARGGMGRIVAAHDLRIGRPVAVKELLDSSAETAVRFEREARITARLQHPGVVPIYEIGVWPDGTPFYAMRMVEGRTLSAALDAAENRLTLLPSLIAAAEAVAFAHAHDVIHRDLKPSNIMVGAFGETVVIDWGLAKDLGEAAEDDAAPDAGPYRATADGLTEAGAVMGTAAYMPPEQASGGTVDRRADVYALGAILYHLLSGHAPYRGGTSLETVERVKAGPPRRLPNSAPRDLASIVAKAMARDPADRYASAHELAEELERFQTGRVVEAHAYSRLELARRWLRRHRAAVIGGTAALVALVIAGTIGLVGIVHERDIATAHEQKEHAIATALLEEQGRQELLAGHEARALAYLDAAMQQGLDTPALRFMLGRALPSVELAQHPFTCGGDITSMTQGRDTSSLVGVCHGELHRWDLASGRDAILARPAKITGARIALDDHAILSFGSEALLLDPDGSVRAHLGPAAWSGVFSRDYKHATIFYADGTTRVWELAGAMLVHTTPRPAVFDDNALSRLSFDGRRLVFASIAGHVEILDVETGTTVAMYEHGPQVTDLSISDDGGVVAVCGTDHKISLWRSDTATARVIDAHIDPVRGCTVSRDGSQVIATGTETDLWSTATGAKLVALPAQTSRAIYSADSTRIATVDTGVVKVWAADTGALLISLDAAENPGVIGFSSDARTLFMMDGEQLTSWRVDGPRRASVVPSGDEVVFEANRDGSRMVSQRRDGSLWLWSSTGEHIPHVPLLAESQLTADLPWLDLFSGDGHRLAAWTGAAVVILDAETGVTLRSIPIQKPLAIQLDARGDRVLIVDDGAPQIWDVDRGVLVARLEHHAHALGLSADGRSVLAWNEPAAVDVWAIDEARPRTTLALTGRFSWHGYDATGTRALISEQVGNYAAALFGLYDLANGKRLRSASSVQAVFDPSTRHAVVSGAGSIEVWNVVDGSVLRRIDNGGGVLGVLDDTGELLAHGDGVRIGVASARDGRVLATIDRFQMVSSIVGKWFFTVGFSPRWLPSTSRLFMPLGHGAVWDLPSEHRDAGAIHRIIEQRVPWRVVDGALAPVQGRIEGRSPPGVVIARREPLDTPYETTATPGGRFAFPELPLGIYQLTAGAVSKRVRVTGRDPIHIDLAAP